MSSVSAKKKRLELNLMSLFPLALFSKTSAQTAYVSPGLSSTQYNCIGEVPMSFRCSTRLSLKNMDRRSTLLHYRPSLSQSINNNYNALTYSLTLNEIPQSAISKIENEDLDGFARLTKYEQIRLCVFPLSGPPSKS
jgi:hypothetical protein